MKGTLYLILTGLFLSTTGIWAKLIGPSISPFLLTIIRTMAAAALILLLIVLSKNIKTAENLGIKRKDILPFLLAGFCGVAIGFGFYIKAFSYVPVANAVMLVYIYPVATALLSFAFLRERITRWEIAALLLVLLGVWWIYGSEISLQANALGNLLALAAGLGYSVLIVSMRHFEQKKYPYWKAIFWPLLIGGLLLSLFLPFEYPSLSLSGAVPVYVAGISLTSFCGYIFYAKGLKTVRAHDAVIITALLEPLAAILLAVAVLGEALPPYVALGGALIVLANILVGREHRKKRLQTAEEKSGASGFGWVW
jgi:drug/metabolite transporter (DMT)-like permease